MLLVCACVYTDCMLSGEHRHATKLEGFETVLVHVSTAACLQYCCNHSAYSINMTLRCLVVMVDHVVV